MDVKTLLLSGGLIINFLAMIIVITNARIRIESRLTRIETIVGAGWNGKNEQT